MRIERNGWTSYPTTSSDSSGLLSLVVPRDQLGGVRIVSTAGIVVLVMFSTIWSLMLLSWFCRERVDAREGHLTVREQSFSVNDREYQFERVYQISYYRSETSRYYNFSYKGLDHRMRLRILLRGETKPIVIDAGQRTLFSQGEFGLPSVESLNDKYKQIAERSWGARFSKFLADFYQGTGAQLGSGRVSKDLVLSKNGKRIGQLNFRSSFRVVEGGCAVEILLWGSRATRPRSVTLYDVWDMDVSLEHLRMVCAQKL